MKLYRALKTFKDWQTGKIFKYDDIDLPEDVGQRLAKLAFVKEVKLAKGAVYLTSLEEISQIQRKPSNKKSMNGFKDGLHKHTR